MSQKGKTPNTKYKRCTSEYIKNKFNSSKNTIMKDPPAEKNFSLLKHQKINFNNLIKNLQL
ncbi:hypothetical protein CMU59_17065 [Elizabethkingia anophelis]|nr:hypothetical protein [Elizabethkingia anophelis]MDV3576843.1 hypothetical protein [Elizabethkingia anophelis]MDV3599293.1 hypothetical protein [Elizabethkingia anophelis]MDV3607143.1 hypothetical protein [Elizabethkingia anophelis]MDV3640353.1 hypothetical protein [Elizabethkingia anophelis]